MRLNQCKFDESISGIGIVLQMSKISMFAVSGQQPLSLRRSILCRNPVTIIIVTPLLHLSQLRYYICRNPVTTVAVTPLRF